MLTFLRVYMYWAVLWGFMVHPAFGLRDVAPAALVAMDLLMMGAATGFILTNFNRLPDVPRRQLVLTGWMLIGLTAYGITVTWLNGGAVAEGAKYVAVLLRPALVLMSVYLYSRLPKAASPQRLYATLRFDLTLLTAAQLIVATIQLVDPTLGSEFIVSLGDQQSAIWALEDGDVSGTFPNSIELSYFLLATYLVLTLGAWQHKRPPSMLLSLVFLFYVDATGSMAATIIIALYMAFMFLRCLNAPSRRGIYVLATVAAGLVLQSNTEVILTAIVDKFDNMMFSRLGLLFISLPGVFDSAPVKLFSGSGADFDIVLNLLNGLPDVPLVFTYDESAIVINDVFWVALILSVGLPMTMIYVHRLAHLLHDFIGAGTHNQDRAALLRMLLLVIFLAGMLNQILLVRSFVVPFMLGMTVLAVRRTTAAPQAARDACPTP